MMPSTKAPRRLYLLWCISSPYLYNNFTKHGTADQNVQQFWEQASWEHAFLKAVTYSWEARNLHMPFHMSLPLHMCAMITPHHKKSHTSFPERRRKGTPTLTKQVSNDSSLKLTKEANRLHFSLKNNHRNLNPPARDHVLDHIFKCLHYLPFTCRSLFSSDESCLTCPKPPIKQRETDSLVMEFISRRITY